MLRIYSILKLFVLTVSLAVIISCGEDNENNQVSPETPKYKTITASSYKVTGKIQRLTNTSDGIELSDWNKGIQLILLEIDTKDSEIIVGSGAVIDSTGRFTFTMRGELYSQYMYDLADSVDALLRIPNDLLVSSSPVRAYAIINEQKKEIFCRSIKSSLDSVDVEYYWNFYSTEGEIKRFYSGQYDDLKGKYDIKCRRGWNLIEHKISPSEFKSIDVLPDDVIFYIYQ